MAKKKRKAASRPDDYSPEAVKRKRTLPKADIALMCVLVAIQVILVLFIVFYTPDPKDCIEQYSVTVEPREDGSLDITYELVWTALDEHEPLTWVEIGMANPAYRLYDGSVSDTVLYTEAHADEYYCSHVLHFPREYMGGETVSFSFKINQQEMLIRNPDGGYFYEFVPGWFNEVPVKKYTFRWKLSEDVTTFNAPLVEDGYALWSGEMDCGGYAVMQVGYKDSAFPQTSPSVSYVTYQQFEGDGAYNELNTDRYLAIFLCAAALLGILIWQIYIVDCFVSYHRGRGFLSGYGHRIHTYGRVNPRYRRAYDAHNPPSSGRGYGGGGRGCACACACACAGGGRAGCSQKDTKEIKP